MTDIINQISKKKAYFLTSCFESKRELFFFCDIFSCKALDIDPTNFAAAYSLAGALADAGCFDEAIEIYRHVLNMNVSCDNEKNFSKITRSFLFHRYQKL